MTEFKDFCAGTNVSEIESKPAALALLTIHYQAQWSYNPKPRPHQALGSKSDYQFLHRGRTILEIEVEKKVSATYRAFKFLLNNGLLLPESYWDSSSEKNVAITHLGIRCHLCARYRLFGISPEHDNDMEYFLNPAVQIEHTTDNLRANSRVAF